MTTGVEQIDEAFARARANGRRAALMPYLMGGFPTLEQSAEIGLAYARAGADLVELGVPFSDPLADGPVIHAAATTALQAGATLPGVLEVAGRVAAEVPVVVMCYVNVILARGWRRFADALVAARVSGLIVPDLPLEESAEARTACEARGLALIGLVAPTTPDDRLARIGARGRGVSLHRRGNRHHRRAGRAGRGPGRTGGAGRRPEPGRRLPWASGSARPSRRRLPPRRARTG